MGEKARKGKCDCGVCIHNKLVYDDSGGCSLICGHPEIKTVVMEWEIVEHETVPHFSKVLWDCKWYQRRTEVMEDGE